MSKKLAAVVPVLGLLVASNAHAVGLATNGNGSGKPAPVAPATDCASLKLYAADTSTDPNHLQRYRFSGECRINVAPQGKTPVLKTVPVLINAEWFPRMKRASETLVVQDPDLGIELSTWATCPTDPFVERNVACHAQGIGESKFSAFLRSEDVPFARGRTSVDDGKTKTEKLGADTSKLYQPVQIKAFQQPGMMPVGTVASYLVDVTGGIRLCPLKIDFGDGTVTRVQIENENRGTHIVNHTWSKPGIYKVRAIALPGCTGEAEMTVIVKTPYLKSVSSADAPAAVGAWSKIAVAGADGGMCKMHIDWGDGGSSDVNELLQTGAPKTFSHNYASVGKKSVKVKGEGGCTGEVTTSVDVVQGIVQSIEPGPVVKLGNSAGFMIHGIGEHCGVHIDYGDGAEDFPKAGFGGVESKMFLWRIYKKPGAYTVKVSGINGCQGTATRTVQVVQ